MKIAYQKIIVSMICIAALNVIAANTANTATSNIALESFAGKSGYAIRDTVTVGIRVDIPRGYHLYANPLGPGIGRPLALYVDTSANINWIAAYKSEPERYNPQVGDWVWAYKNSAYFFLRGVVSDLRGVESADSPNERAPLTLTTTIDALICRTSCIPIRDSAEFRILVDMPPFTFRDTSSLAFPNAPDFQSQFSQAQSMEFRKGRPEQIFTFDDDDDTSTIIDTRLGNIALDLNNLGDINNLTNDNQIDIIYLGENSVWNYEPIERGKREYNFWTAIIFAFIAGLMLNLTPCIFPVLSVRILSFAQGANEPRYRAIMRSVAFAIGIFSVFMLLASLAAFVGLSWGEQFQNPYVLIAIITMIVIFALWMFDFFTLSIPSAIANAERKTGGGIFGDFLKGVMATIMATPCGGPFLGALMAWALLQKSSTIYAIFAAMGVGMALPYIILSSSKKLQKLLPKPGRWVSDLKYGLGFLLLFFAINLFVSLDMRFILTTVGICVSVLCAASVYKRFVNFDSVISRRAVVIIISVAIAALGSFASFKYLRLDVPFLNDNAYVGDDHVTWKPFTPAALKSAHENNQNVIVNFTAAWCTNCKLNDAFVLNTTDARTLYEEKNILLLTADITNYNPEAQELLHHLGSRSIPFIAIFPKESPNNPIIKRDVFRKRDFINTLQGLSP